MKVAIMIGEVSNLSTRTKSTPEIVTTIQFDARVPPGNIARLVNLQRQGAPILVSISCPQAIMDLAIEEDRGAQSPLDAELRIRETLPGGTEGET